MTGSEFQRNFVNIGNTGEKRSLDFVKTLLLYLESFKFGHSSRKTQLKKFKLGSSSPVRPSMSHELNMS